MYQWFEVPTFSISILYFDNEYEDEIPSKLQFLLKKYGFFPPTYIQAGRLTRRKVVPYEPTMESYLEKAFLQKKNYCLQITDAETLESREFCRIDWQLTCYTKEQILGALSYRQWNVLTFVATYGKLQDEEFRKRYYQCALEAIHLLKPFYATADDTAVAVNMSQVTGMNRVLPTEYGKVKAIHWGNYFGPEYCEKYGLTLDSKLPLAHIETIGDGLFFTLTESPLDFDSKECAKRRKEIARKLGVKPPNLFWR